jgi:outer membrane protein assembly factor BamB
MLRRRQALALTAAVLLAACSHGAPVAGVTVPWPMYQGGLTHNAVMQTAFPAVHWTRKLAAKNNAGFGYDGKYLYADDFNGNLLALDPRNGAVVWQSRADDVLMSTPVVADGTVFVGSGTNAILFTNPAKTVWGRPRGNHWYAFRSDTGALVWSYATKGEAMPTAAYADGRLIFATGDNVATAVDASAGRMLWKTQLPGVATMGGAMVDDGLAYVTTTQGKFQWNSPTRNHTLALDVRAGKVRWSAPYGNADCTPTIADGLVFVEGAKDGPLGPREAIGYNSIVALDARTGTVRWKYDGPEGVYTDIGSNERAIAGTYAAGVLYQSLPANSELIAFAAQSGRILWRVHTSGPLKMGPVVYRGNLYAGDTSGVLYKIDARTGAIRSAWLFNKPFTTAPPLIVGGTFFFSDNDTLNAIPLASI